MRSLNVEFDVEQVDHGAADDLARDFLRIWRRSCGSVTSDLEPISSHLVLFDGTPGSTNDVPDPLSCGPNALSSRVFGRGWSEHPEKARELLNKDYRALAASSYRKAANYRVPVFDLIHSKVSVGSSRHVVSYQRLILPFFEGGAGFLLCYSHQLSQDLFRECPEATATLRDDRILESINQRIQKSPGAFPNPTHEGT